MSLIPYMLSFIGGAIGWSLGKKVGGTFGASVGALVLSILGFYYGRKYVKHMQDLLGR